MEWVEVIVMERSQRKGVKPKTRRRKLKSVHWQGALKQKKGVKKVER